MFGNLLRLTGAADRYEAICLMGMFGTPVLLLLLVLLKLAFHWPG